MVNDPNVEELEEKLGTVEKNGKTEPASKYALCVVVSKRARQIIEREHSNAMPLTKDKEVVVACKEIMDGKITYTKD